MSEKKTSLFVEGIFDHDRGEAFVRICVPVSPEMAQQIIEDARNGVEGEYVIITAHKPRRALDIAASVANAADACNKYVSVPRDATVQ